METVRLGAVEIEYLLEGDGGAYELVRWTTPSGTSPPPLHVHRATDEGFYVLSGSYRFVLDGQEIEASPGSHVLVPRGSPHTFWNSGSTSASCLIILSPPGFAAYFRELASRLSEAPPEDELAVRRDLSSRYDMEVVS